VQTPMHQEHFAHERRQLLGLRHGGPTPTRGINPPPAAEA
jgi:hypothetical protein